MLEKNLLHQLDKTNLRLLTKEESYLLEGNLFTYLYEELLSTFKEQNKDHARFFINETDDEFMEKDLARCIVNDILASELYTIAGIALYTHTTEDVILDIALGKNPDPTGSLLRKIIELHRTVRPTLYHAIMHKFIQDSISSTIL